MLGVPSSAGASGRPSGGSAHRPRRRRLLGVFRIAFGIVGLASGRCGGARLGDHPLRRTVTGSPTRLRVGAQAVRGAMFALLAVSAVARCWWSGWWYRPAIVTSSWVHVDRAARRHDVPQPLLVRDLMARSCASCRRTPACRSTLAARLEDVPRRRGVPAAGPGGGGVRLRRPRQAPRRLAGARPAVAPVAPGRSTAWARRRPPRPAMVRPRPRPRRRAVRLRGGPLAPVAADSPLGLRGRRDLPPGDLAAVRHRRVPLVDDRRRHRVLRARLAATAEGAPADAPWPIPQRCGRRWPVLRSWPGWRGWSSRWRSPSATTCTGRRPVDERGLPVLVERPGRRAVGRRRVPDHRSGDRADVDRRRGGALHLRAVAPDGHRTRPHPPGCPRAGPPRRPRATTVEVRADAFVSLNGRPRRLVDPTVDLAAQPRDLWHDDWIEPAEHAPAERPRGPPAKGPPGRAAPAAGAASRRCRASG